MPLQEAINVIKKYGSVFENQNGDGIARPESWVPCFKGNIIWVD